MTAKSKKIDISSTKSMDVTTKKATDMPVNEEAPKIVLNGQKHIKDISPAEGVNDSSGSTKINITENLASNLKTPIETKKIIEPIEPSEETTPDGKPSDDLTDTNEKNRDESFIDKISDDENEKEESQDIEPTSEQDSSEDVEPKEDETEPNSDTSSQQDDDNSNDESEDKTDDTKEADAKPKDEQPAQGSGDEGIVNELAEQAADTKKQKQEAKAQDERNQKIEELIAEKKYFVPIGQITHRRNTRLFIFIIFLVIIVGLFGINLAIDAGMLDIGVEPLTDIIPL